MARSGIEIMSNRFGDIAKAFPDETSLVVGKTIADLESEIKQNIVDVGAVDSGTMLNTTEGHHEPGDLEGEVTTAAPYWRYVNDGTHKMAARPFVEPAVDAVRPGFEDAMKELFERM